jgi:hypothetical protein
MHSTMQRPAAFHTSCGCDSTLVMRRVYVLHIRESLR